MKPLRTHHLKDSRGQSAVEFALIAFLLLMVLFGVIEMCRLVLVYTTVANSARVGTRYAIVHGSDSTVTVSQIQTVVNNYLSAGTANASATVAVNYPDPVGASTSGCTSPGCHVTVTVSYAYDPLTSYFPFSVTLGSTSQGVITF